MAKGLHCWTPDLSFSIIQGRGLDCVLGQKQSDKAMLSQHASQTVLHVLDHVSVTTWWNNGVTQLTSNCS